MTAEPGVNIVHIKRPVKRSIDSLNRSSEIEKVADIFRNAKLVRWSSFSFIKTRKDRTWVNKNTRGCVTFCAITHTL